MGHIKLKPNKQFEINFNPNDLNDEIVPEESKKISKNYMVSKKLAEDENYDLMLMFENHVAYGFDYLHEKTKKIIVEINPATIFYANSIMSHGNLNHYKELLLSQSQDILNLKNKSEPLNLTHSGIYFQLAINCVINLQATLESYANSVIPENYPYLDKSGNPVNKTVTYKLYNALPKVKEIDFQQRKNKKYNITIDKLIKLRNDIIHLKPVSNTNTGYKSVYRDLLNFDFAKALLSVKTFINFYEPNLLEECTCGNEFYFYSGTKLK